jgi:predicted nucleic acid-binding protein
MPDVKLDWHLDLLGAVPLTTVDAIHVAAAKALKCDEFITAEKPGKPLPKARGLKVSFLPIV